MAQYVPNTWADGSSGGTPITAAKLTAIEDQLVANDLQNTSSEAFATLSTRFTNVGAWAINTFYAVNNVCTSGGALFYCLTAHTSTGPAPTGAGNSNWAPLGVVIGTNAGQAPDAAAVQSQFNGLLQVIVWNKTTRTWPAANSAAIARFFVSVNDSTATSPTGLQPWDLWFKAAS